MEELKYKKKAVEWQLYTVICEIKIVFKKNITLLFNGLFKKKIIRVTMSNLNIFKILQKKFFDELEFLFP